jgi:hypothetical protein
LDKNIIVNQCREADTSNFESMGKNVQLEVHGVCIYLRQKAEQ